MYQENHLLAGIFLMAIIILIIKDNTNKVVLISSKQGLSNKIKNFYLDQYINKLIDKNINLVLYLASIIITEKNYDNYYC
ncbi:hypothetical protein [Thomasclavelia ramosa]|uniref:hypothetical protein n=1 Tax=Thomasclavelia ramosa TaxID=1547 RepID=UPI0032BFAF4F